MSAGRAGRVRAAWLGLFALLLAGSFLSSCAADGEAEIRRIDWNLSDSLKNYATVVIALVDPHDTSKVLAVVHDGKLDIPAAMPTYTVPDSIGADFVIRIRGFDSSDLLAFESRIGVVDGEPGTPERTPAGDLPAYKPATRLAGLDFSAGALTPAFQPDVFAYVLDVPYEVESVVLNALASDSGVVLDLGGKPLASGVASEPIPLLVRDNLLTVTARKAGSPPQSYSVTVRRAAGNAARLASLDLSAGSLSPAFHPDSTKYAATVPAAVETVFVSPASEDSRARVEIGGETLDSSGVKLVRLQPGASATLEIVVLSQDSSKRETYSLKLTRALSSDAALRSLFVTGVDLSPEFMPDHLTYGAQIAQAQFAVLPVSRDTAATIKVDGVAVRSGALSGLLGSPAVGQAKVVQVEVTAADRQTVRTYSLSLIRVSVDNALAGLALSAGGANVALDSPFVSARLAYKASVARAVQAIRITLAKANSPATGPIAKITLGDSVLAIATSFVAGTVKTETYDGALALGWNLLKVEVTGGPIYAVRIFRELSKEARLASLTVSAGVPKPSFSDTVTAYTDSVPHAADSMRVTAAPKDTNARRMILRLKRRAPLIVKTDLPVVTLGKPSAAVTTPVIALPYQVYAVDTLLPGTPSRFLAIAVGHNLIEVEVTAEDTTVKKVYTIAVERRASSNAFLSDLIVRSSAGAVLALDPAFASRTLVYGITTTSGFVTVTPQAGEAGQTITVAGAAVASGAASASITLAAGTADYPVVVTAPDRSTTARYTLRITKRTLAIKDPILTPIP